MRLLAVFVFAAAVPFLALAIWLSFSRTAGILVYNIVLSRHLALIAAAVITAMLIAGGFAAIRAHR